MKEKKQIIVNELEVYDKVKFDVGEENTNALSALRATVADVILAKIYNQEGVTEEEINDEMHQTYMNGVMGKRY